MCVCVCVCVCMYVCMCVCVCVAGAPFLIDLFHECFHVSPLKHWKYQHGILSANQCRFVDAAANVSAAS
jgi:hypothetical protein